MTERKATSQANVPKFTCMENINDYYGMLWLVTFQPLTLENFALNNTQFI